MQRTLLIQGFLGIKQASIEAKTLTVIIGEQASGKSVIARLFYFFNQYFFDFDEISLARNEHKKTYDKRKKDEFYQLFPPYAWEKDEFEIEYEMDTFSVKVLSARNSGVIEISTSPEVASYFRELKKGFKRFVESLPEDESIAQTRLLREFRRMRPELVDSNTRFEQALFVPAARSFYATIRDEIFSILALDTKIDQIILQFGEFYESAKGSGGRLFTNPQFAGRPLRGREENSYFQKIVKGQFVRDDGQDWIQMDRGRIELSKASSGQQEAVPLLFSISKFPSPGRTLIIEEPEAHLFPQSQVQILEYMVKQTLRRGTSTIFTTHSPYLLTALNTLILANEVQQSGGIDFEEVGAYALISGRSNDITDLESRMISADYIDSVTEELDEQFIQLLDRHA